MERMSSNLILPLQAILILHRKFIENVRKHDVHTLASIDDRKQ